MAKIFQQEIPSEIYDYWTQVFRKDFSVTPPEIMQKRSPFEIGYKQGLGPPRGSSALPDGTINQRYIRTIFRAAVDAFNAQPKTGGVTPPALGPRNRSWWYAAAIPSGFWYYNYFMQQTLLAYLAGNTPDWAKKYELPQGEGWLSFWLGFNDNKYSLFQGTYNTNIGRYWNYLQLARDEIIFYHWTPDNMPQYFYLLMAQYLYYLTYTYSPNLRLDISALIGNPLLGDNYTYEEVQAFIGPTLSYLELTIADNNKYSLFDFTELKTLFNQHPEYTGIIISSKCAGTTLHPTFQTCWSYGISANINKPNFIGQF